MDPNKTLQDLREAARIVHLCIDDGVGVDPDLAERFAESFTALDEWIRNGGFLPKSWVA